MAAATFTSAPPPVSVTPTPNASPAPTSTVTVAIPTASPAASQLAAWTADQADQLIAQMEAAVLEFDDTSPGLSTPPYRAVWYAIWDALAHFPDDPRADGWRWKLPYYMALSGEGDEATHLYADLIGQALNEQGIAPAELPAWFQSGELTTTYFTQHFELQVNPIEIPGHAASHLIAIGSLDDIDTPGGTCLLVVPDPSNSIVYPLYNGFSNSGFFGTFRNPINCFAKDVTDDGVAEVVVNQYSGGHVGTTTITVLDTSQLPPQVMPFSPARDKSLAIWGGWIDDYLVVRGQTQLQVGVALGFCEEFGLSQYQWNGAWFEVTSGRVVFGEHLQGGDEALFNCLRPIKDYARGLTARDAVAVFDQAYTAYAPTLTHNQEMLEEFRILKGVYSAYAGEFEAARAVLTEVTTSPTVPNSAWVQPVQAFLDAFETPGDLYCACPAVNLCAPYYAPYTGGSCQPVMLCEYALALPATVDLAFSATPLAQLTDQLRTAGAQIPVEGWFDFDSDHRDELWFGVTPPEAVESELWIATEYDGRMEIYRVGALPGDNPAFTPVSSDLPGVLTDLGNGQTLELVRHPLTGEPFAVVRQPETPQPIIEILDQFKALREMLLRGSAAAPLYAQLLEIDQTDSTCPFQVVTTADASIVYYDCAAYRYTLALAAELAGNEREAIRHYQAVLSEYPASAFATLARARLGGS